VSASLGGPGGLRIKTVGGAGGVKRASIDTHFVDYIADTPGLLEAVLAAIARGRSDVFS
jgi:hypothetical protein